MRRLTAIVLGVSLASFAVFLAGLILFPHYGPPSLWLKLAVLALQTATCAFLATAILGACLGVAGILSWKKSPRDWGLLFGSFVPCLLVFACLLKE